MGHQKIKTRILAILMVIASNPIAAADLVLPSLAESIENTSRQGSIKLPFGQYGLIRKPSKSVSGEITRRAWIIRGSSNAIALSEQLGQQLTREGYRVQWKCTTDECGGFDFRYGIETSPPPKFQVDIDDFYYFDYRNSQGQIETLLVSDVNENLFLQQTSITPMELPEISENPTTEAGDGEGGIRPTTPKTPTTQPKPEPQNDEHNNDTRNILSSVTFDSGSSTPSNYDKTELQKIAERLSKNSVLKVYIVGHSDQSGSLAANLNITKARAQSVRQILINEFQISPDRIFAEGVGFLAPIANNNTEAGQAKNRRVEAVYLTN